MNIAMNANIIVAVIKAPLWFPIHLPIMISLPSVVFNENELVDDCSNVGSFLKSLTFFSYAASYRGAF